jgi:uncharacterized repeat protein (TIGR03803 family)
MKPLIWLGVLSLSLFACLAQAQTETVLYNFTGGGDGSTPWSNLTSDGNGNFYGTTNSGGTGSVRLGGGTVFELSPNGNGGWTESVLYSFCSASKCTDGENPGYSSVIFDGVGNLYGTTQYGGANGEGVVYELSPGGKETVLYSFTGGVDDGIPSNGLIMDAQGNLYGTNAGVGDGTHGGVFELSPSGSGWTEQAVYVADTSFAGLTMDANGNIFGLTFTTVFELSPNGNGGWTPTVIHTFAGAPDDGSNPEGTLVFDQTGNLYGTTTFGGLNDEGTVYELIPGNNGVWTEQILYSFESGKAARSPFGGVVLDASHNIYGTTPFSGTAKTGTVFELIAPLGEGSYQEKTLWTFDRTDGELPYGGVILANSGKLYGTTSKGGSVNGSAGKGVVFEVNPSASVATTTTLTSTPNPSTNGQAVMFAAVVSSSFGAPPDGETVSFMKGKTLLGTGTLSDGSATFTTSTLKVGTTAVEAVYGGDSNFVGSKSAAVKQVVKKAGR